MKTPAWWLAVLAVGACGGRTELEAGDGAAGGFGGTRHGSETAGTANGSGGMRAGAGNGGDSASAGSDCIVRVSEVGNDARRGGDWAHAVASVQRGLDVARSQIEGALCASVEVWVAAGTYRPSHLADTADARTATFELLPGVALYGGFAGVERARAERDFVANVSALSGDFGGPANPGQGAYHVVTGATGATLDGFTITGGYANGAAPDNVGAGMYNLYASPTVENCTFVANASAGGSGMFNRFSSPVVTHAVFRQNDVEFGDGGAMLNDASSPVVTDCTFNDNSAQYAGGAMSNENGSAPVVTDSTFVFNLAVDAGGAIHDEASSPIVTNSAFLDDNSYTGGAMDNDSGSSPVVTNCTFTGNGAYLGGALHNHGSSPVLTNCTFARNSASGTAVVTNAARASGGALYDQDSSPVVTGCTFTGNVADYAGGAIYDLGSPSTVTNTILWGDRVGSSISELVDSDSSPSTVTFSVVEGGYAGGMHVTTSDPLFLDAPNADFRLSSASPAIDAGAECGTYVTLTDQAGNGRWDIASSANAASGVDIGALEYQGVPGLDTPVAAFSCP